MPGPGGPRRWSNIMKTARVTTMACLALGALLAGGCGAATKSGNAASADDAQASTAETASGTCRRDDIQRVVRGHLGSVQYCYEKQLMLQPDLQGSVTARWTISTSGTVEQAEIARSTVGSQVLEDCVLRWIRRWRFEPPGGGVCVVNYPFVFKRQ